VARAPDPEVVVGPRDLQALEEHVRHFLVVVLTRVDEHLLMMLPDLAADGRRLDELRPRPDDARDLHGAQEQAVAI
jgi:hypothetical protein